MMRLLLPLLVLLWSPAYGQAIAVSSGEHDGFTRLVVNVPTGTQWQLGRTPTGYALRLRPSVASFDLSRAFDRIGPARVADLRSGEVGRLDIDVACPCHAFPFEFRADMLVIDIRDGAPPPGSVFELGLDGAPLLPISGRAANVAPAPSVNGQAPFDWAKDWLADRQSSTGEPADIPPGLRAPPELADLSEMRAQLLMEFSRAAVDGLIDPVEGPISSTTPPPRTAEGAGNLRIGETLTARPVTRKSEAMSQTGDLCPVSQDLMIEAWGSDQSASIQLAEASSRLLGEFDTPDPEAVLRAVRVNLHLGFGAEALQLMSVYPTGRTEEPLLRSMAHMLDGRADPTGPFPAYAACDGPTAFWAVLADPGTIPATLDRAAALRTFSSLPPHLRQSLGPPFAEAFLAADDVAAATEVLEAILRHPGEPDDRTSILMARLALVTGGLASAEARLNAILSDPGPDQASALIALVDLHAIDHRPLDPQVADLLQTYRTEAEGSAAHGLLDRAYILARALSGDFALALQESAENADVLSDLWNIVAHSPDESLVLHAFGADPTKADPPDRTRISQRLLDLGFLPEAQRWAAAPGPITLRAPQTDNVQSALRRRDWGNLPADAPQPWTEAAAALRPHSIANQSSLAEAGFLVEQSESTRTTIANLLESVPLP